MTIKLEGYDMQLPVELFSLLTRPKEPEVKEVTMADLEALYGMKVKVIK